MALSHFSANNLRLFIKTLVTAWVPVVVLTGIVDWSSEASVVIMGASTLTIDSFFRIWGVGDPTTP